MMTFFRKIKEAFASLFKKTPKIQPPKGASEDSPSRETNAPKPEVEEEKLKLWYPGRKVLPEFHGLKMKTRGTYRYGYPQGAVVHYTAGRTRATTKYSAEDIRRFSATSACRNQKFTYFLIDIWGNVFQFFPLNEWGYHAGESKWPTVKGKVSDEFVGIEVMNAGKLKPTMNGYKSWFNVTYPEEDVRHSEGIENIQKGTYLKFSQEQEDALMKLLLWLEENSNGIFEFQNVVGHDEVSPGRKSDPGASLSMTMPTLRAKLEATKAMKS